MSLPEFLGNDRRGSLRIQKTMAQDLADHFLSAAMIGFGAGLPRLQGGEASLLVGLQQLVITLAAITMILSNLSDGSSQALAFQEHEKAPGKLVVLSDGKSPGGGMALT